MPEYRFETHTPSTWSSRSARATSTSAAPTPRRAPSSSRGKHAEDVVVEQHGDSITVTEPGRGRIFGDNALQRRGRRTGAEQPRGPHRLGRRPGPGDRPATRSCAAARATAPSSPSRATCSSRPVPARSGSTRCAATSRSRAAPATSRSARPATRPRSRPAPATSTVETARGKTVVKTGSGDLSVGAAHDDTSFSTGSGDVSVDLVDRGRLTVKGASGDVSIGVKAGVPVWTDITTVSGTIRSDLQGAGQPQEGQDHIEVRAKTVSGDIALSEV